MYFMKSQGLLKKNAHNQNEQTTYGTVSGQNVGSVAEFHVVSIPLLSEGIILVYQEVENFYSYLCHC